MRKREKASGFGLPERIEARPWRDGKTISYRFKGRDGKSVNLGTDRHQAIMKYAQIIGDTKSTGTISALWLMYQNTPYWTALSERTKDDYQEYSKHVLRVFGEVHASLIIPAHIARYLRVERSEAPIRANREKALLSNLMNLAIEQGIINDNPCKHVKRNVEKPRDVTPSPETLQHFIDWLYKQTHQRQIIGMAAEFASLAGNRQIEFLDLVWPQIDEAQGVIRITRAKQRNKNVIELITISPKMQTLINRLKKYKKDCLFVFPNGKNNAYTGSGFRAMWGKCVRDAIQQGVISDSQRFTFHDLRAYYATQHKKATGHLPDMHTNPAITAGTYDRSKQSKRSAL